MIDLTNLSNYNDDVFEYKTISGIKIPVLEFLPAGLAAKRENLVTLVLNKEISDSEFYLRLFCAYSMHPKATARVAWEQLQHVYIPPEQMQEIREGMIYVSQQIDEVKKILKAQQKTQDEFDPSEKEDDSKNDSSGEQTQTKSSDD